MQLRASIVTYFLRSSIGDQVIETLFATGREHTVSHEKKIVARFKAESFWRKKIGKTTIVRVQRENPIQTWKE